MCISRPVFRVGTKLALTGRKPGSGAASKWTSLSRDDAVLIARVLLLSEAEFASAISNSIGALSDGIFALSGDDDEDTRLDFTHGVIVDFRNMVFDSNCFRHRVRACVTVCQHGNHSKIWFRTQCIGRRVGPAESFGAPVEFDQALLTAFFEEAAEISEAASAAVLAHYNTKLQGYASDRDPKATLRQVPIKSFAFRGFDTDNTEVEEVFNGLRDGKSFTEQVHELIEGAPNKVHPTMIAVDLAHPDDLPDSDTLDSFRGDDSYSVYDSSSVHGDIGVFIRHVNGRQQLPRDDYAGLAFDPLAANGGGGYNDGRSPAFRMTGELLAAAVEANPA